MIKTLALFSPPKECKMSLPCSHDEPLPYCADLYLQGMLIVRTFSLILASHLGPLIMCGSLKGVFRCPRIIKSDGLDRRLLLFILSLVCLLHVQTTGIGEQ